MGKVMIRFKDWSKNKLYQCPDTHEIYCKQGFFKFPLSKEINHLNLDENDKIKYFELSLEEAEETYSNNPNGFRKEYKKILNKLNKEKFLKNLRERMNV